MIFRSKNKTNNSSGGNRVTGEVMMFFGITAPNGYLIMDGTEYLKSDYPALAEHLASLDTALERTDYVGTDSDHFKVPNVLGEFPRFSGTNSHTNQGSGADVGVHQNGTIIPTVVRYNSRFTMGSSGGQFSDTDCMYTQQSGTYYYSNMSSYSDSSKVPCYTTIRPTNTSFLPCIKY